MPLYQIPFKALEEGRSRDLGEDLSGFDLLKEYPSRTERVRAQSHILRELSIHDLLSFFDTLATRWMSDRAFVSAYAPLGISFLIAFMRRSNLEPLLKASLRGNAEHLDTFQEDPLLGKKVMAQPRGLITHWLAGNVPMLGMISLIQGLLSKNANVVKLPRENGRVLPSLVQEMASHTVGTRQGSPLTGERLLETILFVYCEKSDRASQELLSRQSDVRVAWGGKESVESVLSLPKRYGTEDVIFGPKVSFAVVSKNSFKPEALEEIALQLALDASVFDQQGCNSPQTVFVEKGGNVTPLAFAEALAGGMEKALKRIPKGPVSADEAYTIAKLRGEYEFSGKVFASRGTEWSVLYSEEKGLAEPCFSRVVFVRPVDDIEQVIPLVDLHKQTVGLLIDEKRKIDFAKKMTAKGVERITEIGKMSLFDTPWDGMFPIDRFVRWVSLS